MFKKYYLEVSWILLMAVTIMNAMIAESVEPSLFITIFVAASVALKGHVVIEYFMGVKGADPALRIIMNAYFIVVPAMMIIIAFFPEEIANLTKLE